jgi:hypothetical protein
MKRRLIGTAAASALVLLLAGCLDDPTASLRGDVSRVDIARAYVELDVGESLTLTAQAYDEQGNALSVLPEIASSDEAIVSVEVDDVLSGDPEPQTIFTITAVASGQATITATAGGVSSAASDVISFPTSFGGSVSAAASGLGWDYVTINSTSNVKFDPAATTATIDGAETYVHSVTADELVLVYGEVGAVTGGTVELHDLVFLNDFAVSSLDASTTVDVAAIQNWGTVSIATAPDISAGPFPLVFYGYVSSSVVDVIFSVSPSSSLTLNSSVYWLNHDTDIDVFYTDAGDGFVSCLGCGGSDPEEGSWTVAGGDTNYFYVELWSGDPTVFQVTISQ